MPIFVYVNEIFITSYLPIVFITLGLFVKLVKEDVLFKKCIWFCPDLSPSHKVALKSCDRHFCPMLIKTNLFTKFFF